MACGQYTSARELIVRHNDRAHAAGMLGDRDSQMAMPLLGWSKEGDSESVGIFNTE
jgi:hypothetical protein